MVSLLSLRSSSPPPLPLLLPSPPHRLPPPSRPQLSSQQVSLSCSRPPFPSSSTTTIATSTNHYEVVCWKDPVTGDLTSHFKTSHPAYLHLQRLIRHEVAAHASWVARQHMVETYDANVRVRRFNRLVGMRTNASTKRTKKKPVLNIPALIIEVIEDSRDNHRPSRHPAYRVLTRHGLI